MVTNHERSEVESFDLDKTGFNIEVNNGYTLDSTSTDAEDKTEAMEEDIVE